MDKPESNPHWWFQYLAWVQTVKGDQLSSLAKYLEVVVRHLTKADLDLELDELESAARMVADEVEMKKASRDKIVQGVVGSRDYSDDDYD